MNIFFQQLHRNLNKKLVWVFRLELKDFVIWRDLFNANNMSLQVLDLNHGKREHAGKVSAVSEGWTIYEREIASNKRRIWERKILKNTPCVTWLSFFIFLISSSSLSVSWKHTTKIKRQKSQKVQNKPEFMCFAISAQCSGAIRLTNHL